MLCFLSLVDSLVFTISKVSIDSKCVWCLVGSKTSRCKAASAFPVCTELSTPTEVHLAVDVNGYKLMVDGWLVDGYWLRSTTIGEIAYG